MNKFSLAIAVYCSADKKRCRYTEASPKRLIPSNRIFGKID